MVNPLKIKLIMAASGTDSSLHVQTDRLGLDSAYKEKHPIVSTTNIAVFGLSSNCFLCLWQRTLYTLALRRHNADLSNGRSIYSAACRGKPIFGRSQVHTPLMAWPGLMLLPRMADRVPG